MKKNCVLFAALLVTFVNLVAQVKVTRLLCENKTNPVGLGVAQPRLTWQFVSDKRNVLQTAYEIKVTADAASSAKGKELWNSGKIQSDQSVLVPYAGAALQQGEKYYWQVRVWDNSGKVSGWSTMAHWQMGLTNPTDWKAKWIEAGYKEDTIMQQSPLFRKQFSTSKKVQSAVAYIAAHGLYEAFINGRKVGDRYLAPGWTVYNKRLQYQVYDVTNLLGQGNNAIGVMLGSGWYRGSLAWEKNRNLYGKDIALLLQLDIRYSDGTAETIMTDESWKSSTSSVLYSEIYNGETQDARKEQSGWATTGFNDAGWSSVQTKNHPKIISSLPKMSL
jgi:alpha-L-rhamnosidase